MQWVAYLWSIFCLIIFAQGLYQIHKPTLLTFSQITVFFTLDTLFTCFFTLWFTAQWFQGSEGESAVQTSTGVQKRDTSLASQGATAGYEYFVTMLITFITLTFRFYFNCILASFVQELLSNPKFMIDQDDVEQDLKNKSMVKRWWIKNEKFCYRLCKSVLS
ncbi:Kei1p NDAI_0B05660 [Naumovozyma dairenensis CBS 421]|uniref:Uncharacterized protein n=1 Tax=Naumovozyma dairenensis (strain ATCC 10597 / BCRC 20456 / CBS 421 / NBRC 0211 / NRRL Y-12639) TaxID=1071378 RepID=G0W738_NAUDC|nr:hypothetical protein NDAI_0B05660 [Naumovozyma dairenensis CBS 421]CCD23599.1 hypothetical protein NDAI_0B05660 [Naumovozyma dairenensis CBS 421]